MKLKKSILSLSIIAACLFISCSNNSSTETETETEIITDDFSYTTVNDNAEIYQIGNKSGKITFSAKFDGLTATPISLNKICSNDSSIFTIEHKAPIDKLYIFDKNSKTTSSVTLSYPEKIIGFEPMLFVLEWNESKKLLYGIIASDPYNENNNINYFVTINPTTHEVNYSDISFSQKKIYSSFTIGTKLYCASYTDHLFKINPDANTATAIPLNDTKIPLIRTTAYSNTIAYGLKVNASFLFNPVSINTTNNTYTDLSLNESYKIANYYGKGFIDKTNNQYINLSYNNDNQLGVLKYNILTQTSEFIPLTSTSSFNINTIIIE